MKDHIKVQNPERRQPEITVVIPVYNRENIVGKTLDSIAAQTLRPLSVILVDNNSTDNTYTILQQWKTDNESTDFEITLLSEATPGAAAARNRGLDAVTSPYTMFFDSDDLMSPNHCQRALDGFHRYPDADIIGWDCLCRYPDGKIITLKFSPKDIFWNNIHRGDLSTQRYAARTSLFRKSGKWNTTCLGWNDIELGIRILSHKPKIIKLGGKPSVHILRLLDSITGSSFSAKPAVWEHSLSLIEATIRKDSDRQSIPSKLRVLNLRRAILAGDYYREGAIEDGYRLIKTTYTKSTTAFYRFLFYLSFKYRAFGGRGINRILRCFF